MTRAVLVLLALSFIGFGLAFALKPLEMAEVLDISLFTPTARTDFRAMYGGLELGFGLFLLMCSLRLHLVRVGLHAAAWAFVGLASVRTVGLLLDGFRQPLMVVLTAIEMMAAGFALWALFNTPVATVVSPPAHAGAPVPRASSEVPAGERGH